MARQDIMPYDSPLGGHTRIRWFEGDFTTDSQVFEEGEPVRVDNSGQLVEIADEPVAGTDLPIGIAAAGPGAGNINPATGNAYADNDQVPVYMIDDMTSWVTENFTSNGTAFGNAAPAQTDIGDVIALRLISNVWGVEVGAGIAANANVGVIMDVLDANGVSLTLAHAGTGTRVVFTLIGAQSSTAEVTVPAA